MSSRARITGTLVLLLALVVLGWVGQYVDGM